MSDSTAFESWALTELFGHQRIIGLVTEQTIGGCSFIRVDVPKVHPEPSRGVDGAEAFTKFFGQGAIYAMTPISEDLARRMVESAKQKPISLWDLPQLPAPREREDPDEEGEEEEQDP